MAASPAPALHPVAAALHAALMGGHAVTIHPAQPGAGTPTVNPSPVSLRALTNIAPGAHRFKL